MTPRYRRVADLFELTAMLLATATGVTLDQIAERFEVSHRTAERMLSALRETFPEIEGTKRSGRMRYWSLPPSSSGALAVLSDVNELRKRVERMASELHDARASAAKNNAIVDDALANSAVGIFILDSEFTVVWTNEALRRYFGLDADEVHGRDKRTLLHDRIRHIMYNGDAFEQRILSAYVDNTHVARFDCVVKAGPGREKRRLQHWSQPIRSGIYKGGRIEHYIDLSAGDVSGPRLLGEAGENESMGTPTTTSPSPDFAGEVVHSVRNPLAILMAAAEGALAGAIDPTEALQQVLRSGQRIANVIRDTLRLVREHELTLESADVSEIVREAISELQWMADARKIDLKIDGVPAAHSILVDRALIVVALADLVRNSIEAVAENGTVVVRASRSTDQQRVCFIVSDSGSGIPEDLRDRGTELYFTTKESGTGLGLAVVKHIVEAHGGQLKIESGDDGGTTVKIDLPDRSPAQ